MKEVVQNLNSKCQEDFEYLRFSFLDTMTGHDLKEEELKRGKRQVSSMIHSARPAVSPKVNIVFTRIFFC